MNTSWVYASYFKQELSSRVPDSLCTGAEEKQTNLLKK